MLATWMLAAAAAVAEGADDNASSPPPPPAPTDAEPVPDLSGKDLRFLKPNHVRMDIDPYVQTDYTAYTLEWGEVKLGFGTIQVGALPRTQLGTVPILDLLGLYNVNAKVDPLRLGPFDLGVDGILYALPLGDFIGTYRAAGATMSLIIVPAWSIHAGLRYGEVAAHGIPDLSGLSPFLSTVSGHALEDWSYDGPENPKADLELAQIEVDTDLRINNRDGFVLRVLATPYVHAGADFGADPPPILGIDSLLETGGEQPIGKTWSASLSYQGAFKHWDMRLGAGWSAIPFQWVLQAEDLSYRFGGKTRRTEKRERKAWKDDKHHRGTMPVDVPPEPPPPPPPPAPPPDDPELSP